MERVSKKVMMQKKTKKRMGRLARLTIRTN